MIQNPHEEKFPFVQCIYASAANTDFEQDELLSLLDLSRQNNEKIGVTGMLLYHESSFFQVLEGEADKVNAVFKRISNDPRHTQVVKLIVEPVEQRFFPNWSMGFAGISQEDLKDIPGLNDFYSSRLCFTQLEASRARVLLDQFRSGRWRQKLDEPVLN